MITIGIWTLSGLKITKLFFQDHKLVKNYSEHHFLKEVQDYFIGQICDKDAWRNLNFGTFLDFNIMIYCPHHHMQVDARQEGKQGQ